MSGLKVKATKLFPYFYINFVRLFKLDDLYQPTYNPNKFGFIFSGKHCRSSDDRINSIQSQVELSKIGSYCDIGSQIGYFVFKIGELNKASFCHGIEMSAVACHYANAIIQLNDLNNVSFMNSKITASSVEKLPTYDMISFLNVFHHIVHFDGFDAADRVMKTLYEKCKFYFIFETGQYDEKGYYWEESLKFMGDQPEEWIKNYLVNLGYKKVVATGLFPTHLSGQKRTLFVCTK